MSPDRTRVAVVGAGAVGLSVATELARCGVDVTLYDRGDPGSGSTGRAAGLCYDAYVDRTDARLAARSLERFRELGVLTDRPYVWVAREGDDHAVAAIREQAGRMRARGRTISVLDPVALADRFPAIETDHLAVGAVASNAGYVDTDAFVAAMVDRARAAGVALRTDCPVSLGTDGELIAPDHTTSPDSIVIAAGPHTRALAAAAGHSLAVGTYRAQVLVAEDIAADPPIFYDASARFYLRPADGSVLVGDGAHPYEGDPDEYDRTADSAFLTDSVTRVETTLGQSVTVSRSRAGLCTATPDRDPLVGCLAPGLFVATGWHGHGFMRAPAVGEQLAKQVLGGEGIAHFDPTRFDGDEPIDLPTGIVD
ncbi:FAD-dependent oxidoreductase [Salinibaculum salinum]|uniref:NAD(P)/FAD-dependent oxidoreductase n=1 Tax=Salinibaculum salinum TaxID=3131996 RepID=UPI0030EF6985